jgi:hypothetical protein
MDELQATIETLIVLDEPEAILPTLRRAAARQRGQRWQALAKVLGEAEVQLELILNAKPAGHDFRPEATAPESLDRETVDALAAAARQRDSEPKAN